MSRSVCFCLTESQFPDGHFSMSALACLKALTSIDILSELQSNCLDIMVATSLQLNKERLLRTYGHDPKDCYKAIFEEWLAGQSPLAPTWENLLQVLRDIDMEDLAKRIEQFFQSTTKSRKKELEVMGEEKDLVDSLQQSLAKVERDLHESEEQNQLLKGRNESLCTENELLHTENESRRIENELLHTENESRCIENELLHTENESLRTENESLRTKNDSLHTENESLHTENESLHTENESLHTEKESLHTEKESLRRENESLKSENEVLRQQVERRHDQLPPVEPTGNIACEGRSITQ